jgi:5-methylcytosine-specific restriction endonuclease McrA
MTKIFIEDLKIEQLNAAVRGQIKVYDGEVQERLRLSDADLDSFEAAKKQGYLTQSGTEWRSLAKAYYHWCRLNRNPLIIVKKKRRYSIIQVEFNVGFEGYSPSQNLVNHIMEIVMQYAQPGDLLSPKYIERVPNEEAEKIASTISKMLLRNSRLSSNYNESVAGNLSIDQLKRKAENFPQKPRKREIETYEYDRNPYVIRLAKLKANGVCQLCGSTAPFITKDGEPFLEVHHIEWLSNNGKDIIENAIALCPNCHRKMHILDLAEDREYLKQQASVDELSHT